MSSYLWFMLAGSVLIFALYGLRCACAVRLPRLRKNAWGAALLSLLFSAAFGLVLARVAYALLMQELDFEYDGIAALEDLLRIDYDNLSFFFGGVGAVLGVLLANRLTRGSAVAEGMDAFAPFGALLVCLFRLGENAFGSYGAGTILPEGSPLTFFPFAVEISVDGGYSYWGWAVCSLSALFALIWAAVAFFRFRGIGRKGLSLTLTLFFLALPQILCESLRRRGMFWLFVHVEQVLCGVLLVAVLLFWILRSGKQLPFLRRWAPLLITLVCFGLLVADEFAIDGSKIGGIPHTVCYAFMCVVLVVMGVAGARASARWNAGQKE